MHRRAPRWAVRRGTTLVAPVVVALVLAGCSGSSSSAERTSSARPSESASAAFAAALATGYLSRIEAVGSTLPVTAAQMRCVASSWVDTIGLGAFEDADLTPDDVAADFQLAELGPTDQDRADMARAVIACGVDTASMFSAMAAGVLTPDQKSCIEARLRLDPMSGAGVFTRVMVDGGINSANDPTVVAMAQACSIVVPTTAPAETTTTPPA